MKMTKTRMELVAGQALMAASGKPRHTVHVHISQQTQNQNQTRNKKLIWHASRVLVAPATLRKMHRSLLEGETGLTDGVETSLFFELRNFPLAQGNQMTDSAIVAEPFRCLVDQSCAWNAASSG